MTFHRLSERRSRMTVQLDWEPADLGRAAESPVEIPAAGWKTVAS